MFRSWHRQSSVVPYHRGRDTVIEFSHGGRTAATWTATRVYPHELDVCGNLHASSPHARVGTHTVYTSGSIAWMCVTDTPYYPMLYQLWSDGSLAADQMAAIVGDSRYRYTYAVSSYADFWTPSRNIGCLAYVPGQGLDPGSVTCYIRSGLRPAPTRRARDCRRAVFGWGSIVQLVLPQTSGSVGTSSYSCSPYEPVDTSARTLLYGHTIRFAGATCTSMRSGLRCTNENGHGFFLSREHSYLF